MAPLVPRSMNCEQFRIGFIVLLTLNCFFVACYLLTCCYQMKYSVEERRRRSRSRSGSGSRTNRRNNRRRGRPRRNENNATAVRSNNNNDDDDDDDDTVLEFVTPRQQSAPRPVAPAYFPREHLTRPGGISSTPMERAATAPQAPTQLQYPRPIRPAQNFRPFIGTDPRYSGY